MKKIRTLPDEDQPSKYWVGYDTTPVTWQRQSKYSPDVISLPTVVAETEDGDRDPRFDQDLEGDIK